MSALKAKALRSETRGQRRLHHKDGVEVESAAMNSVFAETNKQRRCESKKEKACNIVETYESVKCRSGCQYRRKWNGMSFIALGEGYVGCEIPQSLTI